MFKIHFFPLLIALLTTTTACLRSEETSWLELPKIETTSVHQIGTTSFAYKCTILNEGSGQITAFGIVYGTAPNLTIEKDHSTNILEQSSNLDPNASHWVKNLPINQKIYVRAYATNPAGTSYGAMREVYLQRSVESLNIFPVHLELEEEQTSSLRLTFTPNNPQNTKVNWTCTPSDVATINGEGEVKALKVGTATITAVSQDRNVQATCHLTIKKKNIPITALRLLPELTLHLGESQVIDYEIIPTQATDPTVLWTSSDESIVKVENGRVTALAQGEATITLSTTDRKQSATCRIIVLPHRIAVSEIVLDTKSKTLILGASFRLKATIRPSNADNKVVKWTSSNPIVATVDQQGMVKGLKVGLANITATALDGQHQATCQLKVQESTGESPTFVEMKKQIDAFTTEFKADKKDIEQAINQNNRDDMDYYYGQLHDYYLPKLAKLARETNQKQKEMTDHEMKLLTEELKAINNEINQLLAKCQ